MNLLISYKIGEYIICKSKQLQCILLFIVMLCYSLTLDAITFKEANEFYKKENYSQAIIEYKELLKQNPSAELNYNLGNAYYRINDFPHSVLYYSRALKFAPDNEDIIFNLELASSKTIDKIVPQNDVIFLRLYRSLLNLFNTDEWAYISLFTITLALFSILIYFFSPNLPLRKLGLFFSIPMFLLFIFSCGFAFNQKKTFEDNRGAVIMSHSVEVKETPSYDGKNSFILHEGTCVNIIDEGVKGWVSIHISDGRSGWVSEKALERI